MENRNPSARDMRRRIFNNYVKYNKITSTHERAVQFPIPEVGIKQNLVVSFGEFGHVTREGKHIYVVGESLSVVASGLKKEIEESVTRARKELNTYVAIDAKLVGWEGSVDA